MLKNLNELALESKQNRNQYNNSELKLSQKFKNEYVNLNPDTKIVFKEHTAIVTSDNGLDTIIPNQWFLIASYFVDFYDEIFEYKNIIINELKFKKSDIKKFKDDKNVDDNSKTIIESKYSEQEIEFITKFLSDYKWWFGSKTIDRSDFYFSPILSLANVVNLNQSYIATITGILSKNRDLIELLQAVEDENNFTESIDIEDKFFRRVAYSTFLKLLDNFGEEKVLEGYEQKESSADGKIFKVLTLSQYFGSENFIGQFENEEEYKDIDSKKDKRFNPNCISILGNDFSYFTSQWNAKDNGRHLTLNNFNKFLSVVTDGKYLIVKEDNKYRLKIEDVIEIEEPIIFGNSNTIYYGAPGTGKSHRVDEIIKKLDKEFYERVTFHPEYDNAAFVGSYKPKTVEVGYKDDKGEEFFENEIHYNFVPQAFTEIYKRAWKGIQNDKQYYLVIEEINRGNCAEIFGEIFQLLDRDSNYTVSPSTELKEHLETELGEDHLGIKNGLKLPPNLAIYATMNTSDQSLFPMDAAFKRRWDWEYIPICYEEKTEDDKVNDSFNYLIQIELGSEEEDTLEFKWIDFIKGINKIIKNEPHLGMDKCIGNYFVKPQIKDSNTITLKQFVNKVIFYLWNDVFKDEESSIFTENELTYESFFPLKTNGVNNTKLFVEECIRLSQEN